MEEYQEIQENIYDEIENVKANKVELEDEIKENKASIYKIEVSQTFLNKIMTFLPLVRAGIEKVYN